VSHSRSGGSYLIFIVIVLIPKGAFAKDHWRPSATPTPTSPSCISIASPADNTAVSGPAVPIKTIEDCAGMWFEALQVDGQPAGAFSIGQVIFNSTSVADGWHQLTVTSQSENPGTTVLGSVSVVLNVVNGINVPTPTPTPSGPHYSMLGPGAALPSEASCAQQVNAFPLVEFAPWNQNDGTGYDSNQPPPEPIPSYFYTSAGGSELPSSDFATVDGAYAGTTDDIFRVYACKWGIDEDYVRSQAMIESHWHQDCAAANGGNGCNEGGDLNNPGGCTEGLPVTPLTPGGQFCALEGFGGIEAPNQYASWSILQNKVYYGWMTWPMMEQSTPFAVDYRYAEMRGCVNGDQDGYYHSQDPSSATDYNNAVIAATIDPNGTSSVSDWTNLQYLAYGCIQTHFTGSWFDGSADSYLDQFLSDLSSAPWPGGNK
jgi:hypothetical protein